MEIDPGSGVIITSGATEGILASVLGLVDPGDEVIVIEPCYDSYVPDLIMANAIPRYGPLHPPDWTFDFAERRAAFNTRTRALLLTTPHNPPARVFTRPELSQIAQLRLDDH